MIGSILVPLILMGILMFTFYKWVIQNYDYFKKQNLPHLKPYFLFGNTGNMLTRKYALNEFISNMYNSMPTERIFGFFDSHTPSFFIRDPELIKQFAIKDFDHFEDHRFFVDSDVDKLFGNSLVALKGQKWREMRATLSPAFTSCKMRLMHELVVNCAKQTTQYFINKSMLMETTDRKFNVDTKLIFSRYTIDIIATCAFGIDIDSFKNQNNEFHKIGIQLLNAIKSIKIVIKLLLIKLMPKVTKFFEIEFFDRNISQFFRSMVLDNIKQRETLGIHRPDLLNLLLKIKNGNNNNSDDDVVMSMFEDNSAVDGFATVEESSIGKSTAAIQRKWTDDEIIAQCCLFFFAGFDTTSTVLSFIFYELSRHPEIQTKLYAELIEYRNDIIGDRKLQYDDLKYLKYMDQVISETLRFWPPAAVTDRLCLKTYHYTNDNESLKFTVHKDCTIWIPIYAIHHDPKYFPNPEQFDPERFNDYNKSTINLSTYLPFGVGPRNCIGSRFALMTIKSIMYYLLINFEIVVNENTEIPIKISKSPFAIQPENAVNLSFKLRK